MGRSSAFFIELHGVLTSSKYNDLARLTINITLKILQNMYSK